MCWARASLIICGHISHSVVYYELLFVVFEIMPKPIQCTDGCKTRSKHKIDCISTPRPLPMKNSLKFLNPISDKYLESEPFCCLNKHIFHLTFGNEIKFLIKELVIFWNIFLNFMNYFQFVCKLCQTLLTQLLYVFPFDKIKVFNDFFQWKSF